MPLWKKFISPHKLNSWPYSWKASIEQLSSSAPFAFLSLLSLSLGGKINFEALSVRVFVRIWLEARATVAISDTMMHFTHKWMHEKAYFLHKKHHKGKSNLVSFSVTLFDLLDMISEFGAAIPVLLVCKKLLGADQSIHLLSHHLILLSGFQHQPR